jgi:hypothetical protein
VPARGDPRAGSPIQERGALIRDAVARLQRAGRHARPGTRGLKSRWQRPTLVPLPVLWLEPLKGGLRRARDGRPALTGGARRGPRRRAAGAGRRPKSRLTRSSRRACGRIGEVSRRRQGISGRRCGRRRQLRAESVFVPPVRSEPVDVMTVGGGRQAKEPGLPPDRPRSRRRRRTSIGRPAGSGPRCDQAGAGVSSVNTALVINNPYGYVPDIRQLQAALAPGGRSSSGSLAATILP